MRTLKTIPILTRKTVDRYITDAIAILGKYGGSLWVADPRYNVTASDGSGLQPTNNSDVGWVRDLCSKYGEELITNGDFSAGTVGWAVTGAAAALSVTSGVGTVTNGGAAEASLTLPNTVAGKVYEVTADIVALSGTPTVYFVPPANSSLTNIPRTGVGQLRGIFVSGGGSCRIAVGVSTAGASFSIDNISVREVLGRPLFQSTTGFKPKLRRVPKRLGAELVANGDFAAGTAGWSLTAAATVSGGVMSLNGSGSDALATQSSPCFSGKSYQVSWQVVAFTSGNVSVNFGGQAGTPANAVGNYSQVLTPTTSNSTGTVVQARFGIGFVGSIDNISVREVLEWGWAWGFDGVDDGLATVSQPTASSETVIAVSQRGPSRASESKYIVGRVSTSDTSTGIEIYQGASNMQPYGLCVGNIYGPYSDQPVHVISAVAAPTSFKVRQSGVQVGTGSLGVYTSNSNPISIGKAVNASRYFNAGVFAAAYAPAAIPDAELLIVEKAMAQLAGVTI